MKVLYRRLKHSDCWHFVTTCRWWPVKNRNEHPVESRRKPTSGELCNECLAKARRA